MPRNRLALFSEVHVYGIGFDILRGTTKSGISVRGDNLPSL